MLSKLSSGFPVKLHVKLSQEVLQCSIQIWDDNSLAFDANNLT